jgi:hypothetical protein
MADKRKAGKTYADKCMDYADECLNETKVRDTISRVSPADIRAFVGREWRTGNGTQAIMDLGISHNRKTAANIASEIRKTKEYEQAKSEIEDTVAERVMLDLTSLIREWVELRARSQSDGDLRMEGKCLEEIGKLLGHYKTITENTNHNDLTPAHEQLLQEINAKLYPKTDNS